MCQTPSTLDTAVLRDTRWVFRARITKIQRGGGACGLGTMNGASRLRRRFVIALCVLSASLSFSFLPPRAWGNAAPPPARLPPSPPEHLFGTGGPQHH
mmetsp:Transcript_26719/g.66190  ORF Transcript_26719/g.66190 Transcript_26719/m.66190 type:complete len:98 (-) Transcript_26719:12-305(-)